MNRCDKCENIETTFILRRCKHKFCHKCMVDYLNSFTSARIKCPIEGCPKFIEDLIIRECLSNNQIKLYDMMSCSKDIVKCLVKDCYSFISYENKETQFQCTNCQQPNCLSCGTLHYPSERCNTGDQEKYNKAASVHIERMKRIQLENLEAVELIPNAESFECEVCCGFILPRKGVTLRMCLHNFCSPCLESTFEKSIFLNQLVCSVCRIPLQEKERRKLIGPDKLNLMSIKVFKPKFFNCKQPDCNAVWDIGDYKGMHKCPKCLHINCISCQCVHDGLSCEEFKNSKTFTSINVFQKILNSDNHTSCFNCHKLLIKHSGCGALQCDACNSNTCQFTGKGVGPGGCNCTSKKPCHPDCKHGCIPD